MKRYAAFAFICLTSTVLASTTLAQTPPAPPAKPPTMPFIPDYAVVQEGKPIDNRAPEIEGGKPLFPEQTRAPYHKTSPYRTTEITGALHASWGLAFLPDGKFLVAERLPGALRVVDAKGTISPPVSGLEALGVTWPQTGLFDLALDPDYASNHRIFFTFFAFDRGMISGIQVARATFNHAAN
jgi:glucose/arabinose dehydrogenase